MPIASLIGQRKIGVAMPSKKVNKRKDSTTRSVVKLLTEHATYELQYAIDKSTTLESLRVDNILSKYIPNEDERGRVRRRIMRNASKKCTFTSTK